jgi:hypothetical protein
MARGLLPFIISYGHHAGTDDKNNYNAQILVFQTEFMNYQSMMFVIRSESRHSVGVLKPTVLRRPVAVKEKNNAE